MTSDRYNNALRDARASLDAFDRLVVALAGGALALSVTFIGEIVETPSSTSKPWLWIGWGALIVALVASAGSHLASGRMSHRIAGLDEERAKRLGVFVAGMNSAALVLLAVGLGGLALFAGLNL